jgi:hypothetical protein
MPTRTLNNASPLFRLFNEQPDYSFLRSFGSACWPNLRPYNNRKLSFRSRQCVFIGYSYMHKGYKCLDKSTGRIYISRDVVFDESVYPFTTDSDSVSAPVSPPSIFPASEPVLYDDRVRDYNLSLLEPNPAMSSYVSVSGPGNSTTATPESPASYVDREINPPGHDLHATAPQGHAAPVPASPALAHHASDASSSHGPPSAGPAGPPSTPPRVPTDGEASAASSPLPAMTPTPSPASASSIPPPVAPTRPITHLRNNVPRPLIRTDGTVRYDPRHRAFFVEPTSYRTALTDPH